MSYLRKLVGCARQTLPHRRQPQTFLTRLLLLMLLEKMCFLLKIKTLLLLLVMLMLWLLLYIVMMISILRPQFTSTFHINEYI